MQLSLAVLLCNLLRSEKLLGQNVVLSRKELRHRPIKASHQNLKDHIELLVHLVLNLLRAGHVASFGVDSKHKDEKKTKASPEHILSLLTSLSDLQKG